MALARSRQAARRVKDRWKAKQWYKVVAPASFNQHLLAETLADDPAKLLGRRVEATMNDLTGDLKQMHIKIHFRVTEVNDAQCRTEFDGHEMTTDYIRRLTRRGHTKIPAVFDLRLKDGSRLRVKPFAISDRRCQTTQAQAIRKTMQDMLEESAKKHTLAGFLKDVLVDDLTTRIYKEARKIHPVRRIEVAKSEMLGAPAIEHDETPIIALEEPEPEGAEGAEDEGAEGEGTEGEETEDDSEDEAVAVASDSEEE